MNKLSTRKLFDEDIRIVGPRAQDLNEHIATRLWGKWAKANILRSQRTINQMCRHERLAA